MNPRKTLQIFKIWNASIWKGLYLVRRPKTHFLRFVYFLLLIQAWRHIRMLNMRLFHYLWHAQLHLNADHFLTTPNCACSWCSHEGLTPLQICPPWKHEKSSLCFSTSNSLLHLQQHNVWSFTGTWQATGLLYRNSQSRIKYQLSKQTELQQC